jgi:hypothetical protein
MHQACFKGTHQTHPYPLAITLLVGFKKASLFFTAIIEAINLLCFFIYIANAPQYCVDRFGVF